MNYQISLVFPLFNEESRMKNIPCIMECFRKLFECDFEIILVCNGCVDQTLSIAIEYSTKYEEISIIETPVAGRGNALKLGFLQSTSDLIAVCSIDRSWDESFYSVAKNLLETGNYDVIYGPKSHPSSTVVRPFYRTLPSYLIKNYISVLFNIHPVDTNCIKMFRRSSCDFVGLLSEFNYFAETEFYLLALRENLKIFSIPVFVNDSGKGSKVHLSSLMQFVSESIRFKFY